jgi:ABC-2 type transport system permease protein
MRKIGLVAGREFVATVGNKGFVFGLLIMPAILALAAVVGPRIMSAQSPVVRGEVAVIDPTGRVTAELRQTLAPEGIEARRNENARRAIAQAAPGVAGGQAAEQAARRVIGQVPVLSVVERAADADLQREKDWLLGGTPDERHLALIAVHPDAVVRKPGQEDFGAYDLYVSRSTEDDTESAVHDSLRQALINARMTAGSLDRPTVEATMRVPRPRSTIVAPGGEQQAQRGFTEMLPFILGVLMFIGVIIGGQSVMTSTIEEKSSRVVEVLLAAVSPFELMAGKLIGQLGVGLLTISVYIALGVLTLWSFAMIGLLDPMLIVYLLLFFLITYLVFGALMMAIGAAVNQMAEAQSLMGPVMILLMLPYMLSPMIGEAPNSTFSVAVSFIPPLNTFAMMSRIASDSPPPAWQVWLTMVVGIGGAAAAIWFASKVFRIGLLMHGKPPNIATLIRWARAA